MSAPRGNHSWLRLKPCTAGRQTVSIEVPRQTLNDALTDLAGLGSVLDRLERLVDYAIVLNPVADFASGRMRAGRRNRIGGRSIARHPSWSTSIARHVPSQRTM